MTFFVIPKNKYEYFLNIFYYLLVKYFLKNDFMMNENIFFFLKFNSGCAF